MPLDLLILALSLGGGLWALGLSRAAAWPLERPWLLIGLLIGGLGVRLAAMAAPTYQEVDFYRYFWDARQLLSGFNPYQYPIANLLVDLPEGLQDLMAQEAAIVGNIRADTWPFSTIYTPLSILLFAGLDLLPGTPALAFGLSFLGAELAALGLLWRWGSLSERRRGLWALALNPLLILVAYNGLHFDLWLLPVLLGWVLALRARRPALALALLILGIALRHWAVLLLPLTIMAFAGWPRRVAVSIGALALLALLFSPQIWYVNTVHSGLGIYGQHWELNDALFLILEAGLGDPGARAVALGAPAALACLWALRHPRVDPALYGLSIIGLMLMLSPTFFPWYWLWLLPCLILARTPLTIGFAALAAALPFYYMRFWFEAQGRETVYDTILIWVIFVPILVLLVICGVRHFDKSHRSRPQ